ncbi:peptide-methionine (S)-S-oxide reductase MsrA [Magnetococcus sp. PR-3]
MLFMQKKVTMIAPEDAMPGRSQSMPVSPTHLVLKTPMQGPWPGMSKLVLGMGCFWGAERRFWQQDGVHMTAVGYAAGFTPNPTYEEVCANQTGHNEVVLVVYDPKKISLEHLLHQFWEGHNPTQGMRQGNDAGTQYRSGLYMEGDADLALAEQTKAAFQQRLKAAGHGEITTEILPLPTFYYAEDYHQQYLAKNPGGYCGLGGTGVTF